MNELNSSYMSAHLSALMRDTPCAGRRVVLVVPTYGHADPVCQKDVRVAMMCASAYGTVWVGDASPERMGFSAGRNLVAKNVMDDRTLGDDDGVMWIDSDIRMPTNAIATLIAASVTFKADFMTGVYHQRGDPFGPVFYHFNKTKQSFQSFDDYPENVVAPIEGCGFGFVFTSKRAFSAIAAHKGFTEKRGWFPDERDTGGFGEDLSFSYQAMMAGVQLYVHTGVQLGHTGDPDIITREHFLRARPKQPLPTLFVQRVSK